MSSAFSTPPAAMLPQRNETCFSVYIIGKRIGLLQGTSSASEYVLFEALSFFGRGRVAHPMHQQRVGSRSSVCEGVSGREHDRFGMRTRRHSIIATPPIALR